MPDQTGEPRQAGSRTAGWRRIGRRGLVGLSAAGATAAVIITAAASGAPASAAAGAAQAHTNALTETTSSSAGNMTVKATYATGKRGRIKLESVSYVGESSKKGFKHPVLIFTLGPGGPFTLRYQKGKPVRAHFPAFQVILRLKPSELGDFSGTLSAKILASVNRHGGLVGGETLNVSLAHGKFPKAPVKKGHRQVHFTIQEIMQVGMILNPAF